MADDAGDEAEMDKALLCWIQLFDCAIDIQETGDLKDGRILAKVISEMHPGHALDEKALSGSDNPLLMAQNLKRVLTALGVVYHKKLQVPPEALDLQNMVDTSAIAKCEGDWARDMRLVLRLLMTSMISSPELPKLGSLIMDMGQDDATADVPNVIARVMKHTQAEFQVQPVEQDDGDDDGGYGDDGEDDYFGDGAEDGGELRAYGGATAEDRRMSYAVGGHRNAAAYERENENLKDDVRRLNSESSRFQAEIKELEEELRQTKSALQDAADQRVSGREAAREREEQERKQQKYEEETGKLLRTVGERDGKISELTMQLRKKEAVEQEVQQMQDRLDVAEAQEDTLRDEKRRELRELREKMQKQIQEAQKQASQFEKALDEARQDAVSLEQKLDQERKKEGSMSDLRREHQLLEIKNKDLESRMAQLAEELIPAQAEAKKQKKNAEKLQKEKDELLKELEDAQAQVEAGGGAGGGTNLADELAAATAPAPVAKAPDSALQRRLEEAEARAAQAEEAAQDEKDRLESRLEKINKELKEQTARVLELEGDLKDEKSRADQAEEQQDWAQSECKKLRASLHETENKLKEAQMSSEQAGDEGKEHQQELERLKKKNEDLEKDGKSRLESAKREAQIEREELEKEMKRIKDAGEESMGSIRKKHQEELEREREAQQLAISEIRKERDSLKSENTTLMSELQDKIRLVEQAHRDAGAGGTEVAQLRSEIERLKSQSLTRQTSNLEGSTAEVGTDVAQLQAQVRQLTADKEKLKDKMKEKIAKFEKQYDQAKYQSQRELKLISSAFYDMGNSCIQQQLGMLGDNSVPQSWLGRKKFEAHDFSKAYTGS